MAGKAAGDVFCSARGAKKPRAAGLRGRGRGLLLKNYHSKGVGAAIDGFVSDCDFQAGDGSGVKIGTTVDELYRRGNQIYAFHERGFGIRDIRRKEGEGGSSGNVGAQDVRQGLFGGFGKDIIPIVILGDPVFIKQGGDITAELGNLIADGDIIFISQLSEVRLLCFPPESRNTLSNRQYLRRLHDPETLLCRIR